MKLDYSLKTPEERIECVNQLLAETPSERLSNQYLSYMSDYILFVSDKNQTKKEKQDPHGVLTKNREVTISKRETSFEGLVSSLENGEDGLHAMMSNDKNQIMDKKSPITQEDLETIPYLRESYELIQKLNDQLPKLTGKDRYTVKRQIIETWQTMYSMKASYNGIGMYRKPSNYIKSLAHLDISDEVRLNDKGIPEPLGKISLLSAPHVSFLLCYYPQLKQECAEDFSSDMYYMLLDLENLVEKTLYNKYPILWDLVIWKIDGKTNEEIKDLMNSTHGVNHNEQYFSTLWRKRIPKLLAEQAQKDYLTWYYTNVEYGQWKKCSKCGKILLAHPMFFSRNTSKDGFYSQCKECRNSKNK